MLEKKAHTQSRNLGHAHLHCTLLLQVSMVAHGKCHTTDLSPTETKINHRLFMREGSGKKTHEKVPLP